jgi:hypothetical protein
MSTPSQPPPSDGENDRLQPSTQEIPVVAPAAATSPPLPPHPGATTQPPVAAQPTGPVDFVPGPPGSAAAHPSPEPPPTVTGATVTGATAVSPSPTWPDTLEADDGGTRRVAVPRPRNPAAAAGIGLAVLGLVLLELGLLLGLGGRALWPALPTWSAFVTMAALFALLTFGAGRSAPAPGGDESPFLRRAAVGGALGVAVFWLLVVVPDAASNRGFVLTAAVACLGAGVWIGSRRTP